MTAEEAQPCQRPGGCQESGMELSAVGAILNPFETVFFNLLGPDRLSAFAFDALAQGSEPGEAQWVSG